MQADSVNLVLEPPAAVCGGAGRAAKAQYRRSYSEVVELLIAAGMERAADNERRLKSWVAKGRKAGVLPPFDDLPKMAEWWRTLRERGVLKWGVPKFLVNLESGSEAAPPFEAAMTGFAAPALVPVSGVGAVDRINAVLVQLHSISDGFLAAMQKAQEAGNPEAFMKSFGRYEVILERIRKWEATAAAIKEKRGELVDKATERAVLAQVLGVLSVNFTNALLTAVKRAAPTLDDMQARAVVLPLRDRCFEHLKTTAFASCVPPALAA